MSLGENVMDYQATAQGPLTIYVLQDQTPKGLKDLKDILKAAGQEDVHPRDRNIFWFQQAEEFLQKSGMNYELVTQYQRPKGTDDMTVPQIMQDYAASRHIHWVAMPHKVVVDHVNCDNDGLKGATSGLDYGVDFNSPAFKKDFAGSQEYSRRMALALADRIEAGYEKTGTIVGVNIQNRYNWLVPKYLNEEMKKRGKRDIYVTTYFSHIDQTDKLDVASKPPQMQEVVASILGTDAATFHTNEYALNLANLAKRLYPHQVKIDPKRMAITHTLEGEPRTVKIGSHFLGIDVERWQRLVTEDKAWEYAKDFLKQADGRKILFAYDRCDPIKAADDRVEIFGKFLKGNPDIAKDVVLFQNFYLANTTERDYESVYSRLQKRITKLVADVNHENKGELAHPPIVTLDKMSEMQIAGMIIASTISGGTHVVSSVSEGLHMGMLESYVANAKLSENGSALLKQLAQKHDVPLNKNSGALSFWTSKIAGVVHYVQGTFPMHPKQKDFSVRTLRQALQSTPVERAFRMAKSITFIRNNTSAEWIKSMERQMNQLRLEKLRAPASVQPHRGRDRSKQTPASVYAQV